MDAKLWGLAFQWKDGEFDHFATHINETLGKLAESEAEEEPLAGTLLKEAIDGLEKLDAKFAEAAGRGGFEEERKLVRAAADALRSGGSLHQPMDPSSDGGVSDIVAALRKLPPRSSAPVIVDVPAASQRQENPVVLSEECLSLTRGTIGDMFAGIGQAKPQAKPASKAVPPKPAMSLNDIIQNVANSDAVLNAQGNGSAPQSNMPLDQSAPPVPAAAPIASAAVITDEPSAALTAATSGKLDSVLDALRTMAAEWKGDTFWADLAMPVDKALEKLAHAEAAEAEAAEVLRAEARAELKALNEELKGAAIQKMFIEEQRVVAAALKALKGGALPALTCKAEEGGATAEILQALEEVRESRAANNQLVNPNASRRPYSLEQIQNKSELTVKIPVPATTQKKDVRVRVRRKTISVSVAGHPLQPTVIEGEFPYTVEQDACNWHLEGCDGSRVLVLDLEKEQAGLQWSGLLAVQSGQ